ncbi:hypothetical protein [Motilimonas pumila]|nr:hypothetical protein [Motilimonas pumila]
MAPLPFIMQFTLCEGMEMRVLVQPTKPKRVGLGFSGCDKD